MSEAKQKQPTPEKSGEDTEEETPDPKQLAKTMLVDGREPSEIAEVTGLPERQIWGLKGALAKSGKVPTREEEKTREIAGLPPEGRDETPFRRPKTAAELIVEICQKYGVRERAIKIIADRCRRVPGGVLHPNDLERLLMDLDTGLKERREAMLIAEEYQLALEQDRGEETERRGYYYVQPPSMSRSGYYRPESYEPRMYPQPYPPYVGYDPFRQPPTYDYGGGRHEEVSRRDLEELENRLAGRLEKKKEEERLDRILNTISEQGTNLATLASEVKHIKENPPVISTEPKGESDYEKSLKHTIDRQDKRHDELMDIIKTERDTHRKDIQGISDKYEKHIDKLNTEIKDIASIRREAPTGKYQSDEIQFAAEGMNRLAGVIEGRKPVEAIIKFAATKAEETPPERSRMGESHVVDLVPKEYTE